MKEIAKKIKESKIYAAAELITMLPLLIPTVVLAYAAIPVVLAGWKITETIAKIRG